MSPLFWMLFPLLQWASDKSYIWFQLGLESFSFGFQSKGMWAPLMKKAIICSSLYIYIYIYRYIFSWWCQGLSPKAPTKPPYK
jgi:hypothetical protein